jgi:hypothetical protein
VADTPPPDQPDPWAAPPPGPERRSRSTRIFLGVTVAACAVMGLFLVAGVVLMIAFSGSRFGNK